jgi:hypothetical protein
MDQPNRGRKRLILWIVVGVVFFDLIVAGLALLAFMEPAEYRPVRLSVDDRDVAAKQFYRRMMDFDDLAQSNAVFEFVITSDQINRSLASMDEIAAMVPGGQSGRVQEVAATADLSDPAVVVRDGKITLMIRSARLGVVVSGDLAPTIDDQGRLAVPLTAVRVGVLPVPEALVRHQISRTRDKLIALHIAHLADKDVPGSEVNVDLASMAANYSVRMIVTALDGKPIVPEGSYRRHRIRLVAIEPRDDKITVRVVPVPRQPPQPAAVQSEAVPGPAASQTSVQSSAPSGQSR